MRWFDERLPDHGVTIRNLSDEWMGFLVSGPRARDVLSLVANHDISNAAFPFLSCQFMEVGLGEAMVARLAITGELGFEINVPAGRHRGLYGALREAGREFGLCPIGDRAIDSLRLEKSYGVWSREFTQAYTPAMAGLDRFIAYDKGEFVGRDAALRARDQPHHRKLVTLAIDAEDADATGFEPVWLEAKRVGFVTSGAYGHHVGKSLAMAYVDREIAGAAPDLSVDIIGEPKPAHILPLPAHDPRGARLRS
jgi:dimethylglycine dehydrogenase